MYTGKTKNLGVIGYPVAHSLSPVFQNAGIEAAGLDYAYIAMPVEPEKLADAIRGIRALGLLGINVTIPHKQAVMQYLDEIDEDARVIGAVNTIVNRDGYLKGYNTDCAGCISALKAKGFAPAGKRAVLLGAGGAARAIIWGLIKEKVEALTIGVRNVPKVQPLVEYFSKYMEIKLYNWGDTEFKEELGSSDLLINSTPLGMFPKVDAEPPVDWSCVRSSTFVYDIIYTPAETLFLKHAREKGCQTLNGEGMLVGQGAESFKLWTGMELDRGLMASALRKAL